MRQDGLKYAVHSSSVKCLECEHLNQVGGQLEGLNQVGGQLEGLNQVGG